MNDNINKNLNMKSLNDSELEEVSGGVINLELKSESEPLMIWISFATLIC